MSEQEAHEYIYGAHEYAYDWASEPITPFTMDIPLFGPVAHVPNHVRSRCHPDHCPLHNPSDSHMKDWELHWRTERAQFERFCPHGVGHPDPDDLAYQIRKGRPEAAVHTCCGCCAKKEKGKE